VLVCHLVMLRQYYCTDTQAGKTILASVIIEECKSRNLYLTSYYYCNNDDPTKSSSVDVIKGIIEQIVHQYPKLMAFCHSKSASNGEPVLRSPASAKRLLEACCQMVPKLFIVVDGVDELEPKDRKDLLDAIVNLVSVCDADEAGKLRVLIVSQEYSDIRKALHSTATSRMAPKIISLSVADNEDDIRIYVSDLARRIKYEHELDDDQTEYLKERTVKQARGL
jgi:Cdc6-like AAA superfamily ATPase